MPRQGIAALRSHGQAAPSDSRGIDSASLPELLDVRIVSMSPQAFTLSGFERIDGIEFAQSWLVAVP